jgi:branched-chain amino acid transport system substrate-binding protein
MTFGPDPRKLPSTAEVVARFEAEARTLYSYAAVQVFAAAAGEAGSTDLERLERVLYADTFQTVIGPMTFDAKGDNVRYEFRMYRWHDGRYEDICCGPSRGR